MAIVLAQAEVTGIAAGTSVTASFASTPTSGNLLLAVGYRDQPSGGSDNGTITGWAKDESALVQASRRWVSIHSKVAGASESKNVTFSASGATSCQIHIFEVSGIASPVLDKHTHTDTSGSNVHTMSTGSTATTTANDEFWVAGNGFSGASTGFNWTNGFADDAQSRCHAAYLIASSTGAAETTASWTTYSLAGTVICTYKATPAGGLSIPVAYDYYRRGHA